MEENKKDIHFGDGIGNEVKATFNKESSEFLSELVRMLFSHIKEKSKNIPEMIEHLLNSSEARMEIVNQWSTQLAKDRLISKGYSGLPESLLIANLHQEGYLDGLYVGYILVMMALVDNNASEDLILSIRDDIRPNLIGHHYNDRDEFYCRFKNEIYSWIENDSKGN